MKSVEIFFNDLTEAKKQEMLEAVGVSSPQEMNWDIDILPLAIVDFEEEGDAE